MSNLVSYKFSYTNDSIILHIKIQNNVTKLFSTIRKFSLKPFYTIVLYILPRYFFIVNKSIISTLVPIKTGNYNINCSRFHY